MKTFTLALLLIASSAWSADPSPWTRIGAPTSDHITGISFLSPDTHMFVTDKGTYFESFDGSNNWRSYNLLNPAPLEDIQLVSPAMAVMCGRGGRVYVSRGGLNNWREQLIADTMVWFSDIDMIDEKTGFVIGMTRAEENPFEGIMFKTTDSGQSWQELPSMGLGYAQLDHTPDGTTFMLSYGRLHRSTDSGESWRSASTVEGQPGRTFSFYGSHGIMAGASGMCAFTTDMGKTWSLSPQSKALVFIASKMISEKVGYIGGAAGMLMRTNNGGKTWNIEQLPEKFNITDMTLVNNRLYLVGSNGAMYYRPVM